MAFGPFLAEQRILGRRAVLRHLDGAMRVAISHNSSPDHLAANTRDGRPFGRQCFCLSLFWILGPPSTSNLGATEPVRLHSCWKFAKVRAVFPAFYQVELGDGIRYSGLGWLVTWAALATAISGICLSFDMDVDRGVILRLAGGCKRLNTTINRWTCKLHLTG